VEQEENRKKPCRSRAQIQMGHQIGNPRQIARADACSSRCGPAWLRLPATVMMVLGILFSSGCLSSRNQEVQKQAQQRLAARRAESAQAFKSSITGGRPQELSIPELDQLAYGYADRYYVIVGSAVDTIKRNNPDPVQRRIAHQIKLNGVLAVDDIVSGDDPYSEVFDLVVAVTLQSTVWIDENGAEKAFGDRAPVLIAALREMRVEAWELAAKVLTQEQLELLDYLIIEWRFNHPGVQEVEFVKFDEFAGARSTALLSELKSGDGFLAPLSEASLVLKDWGRLSERAFWYSKRAPNIAAIQAEGAVNEILASPEIVSALQTSQNLGKTADALPQTIDAEREAFFADVDARQTLLTNTLGGVHRIVAETDALTTNLQQTLAVLGDTLKEADQVGRTFGMDKPVQPPKRPFDIQDYTAALVRLNEAVTNLHSLSVDADQITRSEGWSKAMKDITDATDRRVDRAFTRLCLLLCLGFILAVAYRVISLKMARGTARRTPEKP
jgi:hypothetical protein